MKIAMIGGGAHRVLGILRGAMAIPDVLDGGEIALYDLDPVRSEAMGRMLLKTPEQARGGCAVTWPDSLEKALQGADVVGIILPALSLRSYALAEAASARHGFICSDNISPTGAMSAVNIAPVLMNVARTMEKVCPNAWLLDFVNPVAVLSGMINNHTRIRTLGVCQGFTNHLWDIPRLFGKDEEASSLDIQSAGVNHLSYVTKGEWEGEEIFEALRKRTGPDWQLPKLQPWWDEFSRKNITHSVGRLLRIWRELGVLIFSTEGDGMDHLQYEEAVELYRKNYKEPSAAELDADISGKLATRADLDCSFNSFLSQNLDEKFWAEHWKTDLRFARQDEDVFVRIFAALAGVKEAKIATSRLNNGAIKGIKDRHVVEYTQCLLGNDIRPAGSYEIPDVVHGITASLAAHQTMLGDALALEDPEMLAKALLTYPVKPYSASSRNLYKELFAINGDKTAPQFRKAVQFL